MFAGARGAGGEEREMIPLLAEEHALTSQRIHTLKLNVRTYSHYILHLYVIHLADTFIQRDIQIMHSRKSSIISAESNCIFP